MSNTESEINNLLKVSVNDESHKTQMDVAFPRSPIPTTTSEMYPSRIIDQNAASSLIWHSLGVNMSMHSNIRICSVSLYMSYSYNVFIATKNVFQRTQSFQWVMNPESGTAQTNVRSLSRICSRKYWGKCTTNANLAYFIQPL